MSLIEFCQTDRQREVIALYEEFGASGAAKKLGINDTNVRKTVRRVKGIAAKRGHSPENDMTKTAPEGYAIRGTSTLYDADGNAKLQWVKTKVDAEAQLAMMREVVEAFRDDLPLYKEVDLQSDVNERLLTVYPLSDAHIGMLADEDETGDDWDIRIAERVITEHFGKLVSHAPSSGECLLAVLGDFWHRFNIDGVSRSGHIFDCDSRFGKMHKVGVKILLFMINECLKKHKSVKMIIASGNHDHEIAAAARDWIGVVYSRESRFSIYEHDKPFYYHQFGKCLIGVTHGDKCKMDRLPSVMACDMAKEWGETEHRHWLTGHVHHDKLVEYPGVHCESFNIMAAKDAYANSGGWRSKRTTTCMVFDTDDGLCERKYVLVRQ